MPLACANNWTSRENRDSHVTPNIHRKWIAWKTKKFSFPSRSHDTRCHAPSISPSKLSRWTTISRQKLQKCSIALEINMELMPLEISELAVNWQPIDAREIQQEVENREQRIFRYLHIGVAYRAQIRLVVQASLFPSGIAQNLSDRAETRDRIVPPTKRESHLHSYRNILVDHRATAPSTPRNNDRLVRARDRSSRQSSTRSASHNYPLRHSTTCSESRSSEISNLTRRRERERTILFSRR